MYVFWHEPGLRGRTRMPRGVLVVVLKSPVFRGHPAPFDSIHGVPYYEVIEVVPSPYRQTLMYGPYRSGRKRVACGLTIPPFTQTFLLLTQSQGESYGEKTRRKIKNHHSRALYKNW